MKVKTALILQTIGMYVMHLPLYAILILNKISMDVELQEAITRGLFVAFLVLLILMIPICLTNVIVSLKSALKDKVNPSKPTMAIKLCLIPWYALNFFIGYVFVSILFNPFLMIAIPFVIAILVTSTYTLMLSTSLGNIAYFIRNGIKRHSVRPSTIVAVVFLFIFCLDVIGSIILYHKSKSRN